MPIIFQKVIHVCANCKTFLLYAGRERQRAELSNFDQDDINSNTFFALNLIENQIFNDSSHFFFLEALYNGPGKVDSCAVQKHHNMTLL